MEDGLIDFGESRKVGEVKIFDNPQFGQIRTAGTAENPLFCAVDVARALGYANPSKAVIDHCKGVTVLETPTNGGVQNMKYIAEPEVYRLIFKSNAPNAEKFNSWLAEDVLPSIRKTGSYSIQNLSRKELALMVIQAEEENERLALENKQQAEVIAEQKPKVVFADAIVGSQSSCLIGELAKIITQNGYKIGQNRLFEWLRQNHYLGAKGEYYNIPNQEFVERGLFEIKKTSHSENGVMKTTSTPKVTGKGQQYFVNLFLKGDNDLFGREIVLPNKEG